MKESQIIDKMNTSFKVSKIPVWALKQFKQYCEDECGNVYAVGIIQLLRTKKQYEELLPIISLLTEDIQDLRDNLKINESEERPSPKTFG